MSDVIAIVPEGWLEIQNANQLMADYGDMVQIMGFLANHDWNMFNTVVDMHLPPDTSVAEAYMLGDSFFVRLQSTVF